MDDLVLGVLRRDGGWVSVKEITRRLGVGRGLVQVVVDKLESDGRVERYHGGASRAAPVFRAKNQAREAA